MKLKYSIYILSALLIFSSCKKESASETNETPVAGNKTEILNELGKLAKKSHAVVDIAAAEDKIAKGKLTLGKLNEFSSLLGIDDPISTFEEESDETQYTPEINLDDRYVSLSNVFHNLKARGYPGDFGIAFRYNQSTLSGTVLNTALYYTGVDPYTSFDYTHMGGTVVNAIAGADGKLNELLFGVFHRNYNCFWEANPMGSNTYLVKIKLIRSS